MAGRRTKAPAVDDELGELFDGIDKSKSKKSTKGKPASSAAAKKKAADQDILADLENELSAQPPSRPHTPKVKETAVKPSPSTTTKRASGATTAAAVNAPPQPTKSDSRKSTDSARSYHVAMTPSGTSSEAPEPERKAEQAGGGGSGWWGGIFATATATAAAAVKQAEGVVTNLQQSEEAKRWTEQVKGNVGALKGLGDELRHRAIPTFTNILHTLAPPISQHERLRIHITHDLVGYPSLDPLIHGVFSRVMSQVEGGDLMVIQRGQESTARRASDVGRFSSQAGWRDGPWWRSSDVPRDMGVVGGLVEGTKLCRVSAESYSMEYYAANGGIEKAKQLASEAMSETNPVRSSDLFLAVQAIGVDEDEDDDLFAGSAKTKAEEEASPAGQESAGEAMVCFAVYILDPVHELAYSTVSQCIPAKWIRWMDAQSPLTPASANEGAEPERSGVPDEIRDIIETGGVDPREWVSEWVEEALDLSVGIVAQRYVARRMGVGVGGIGRGKQRAEDIMEEGGGEAARAGLI